VAELVFIYNTGDTIQCVGEIMDNCGNEVFLPVLLLVVNTMWFKLLYVENPCHKFARTQFLQFSLQFCYIVSNKFIM